jgi:hypothetical protein
MMVMVLFLKKQTMVFLLREVAFQESGEKVDKCMDLIFGEPLAEKISKFLPSGKLQK